MRKSISNRLFSISANWILSRHAGAATVVVASLALAGWTATTTPAALAAAPHDEDEGLEQDSVLVATRSRVAPATDTSEVSLRAEANSVEQRPELGHGPELDTEAEEFGAALAELAIGRAQKGPTPSQPVDLVEVDYDQFGAEPAKFNGIQPGTSTTRQLKAVWGEPTNSVAADGSRVLTYDLAPFRSVEVLISDDVVQAVKIELSDPVPAENLVKQLSLQRFEVVNVTDDEGQVLGQVFPERGVLFMPVEREDEARATEAASAEVSHVVIQPLDAHAFALRAENHLHGPYKNNIRDLRFALALDPELAHARWLLSDIYLSNGQGDLAESEAAKALNLDPENSAYQLRWAQSLELLSRYDEAVQQTRKVLDRKSTTPIVKAQALHEMARLAGKGEASIAKKAIAFDNEAIEIADKLATSKIGKERHVAKEVLIQAHLNIAQEIANQPYNKKMDSLSEWFGRASGLAEDYIANDDGSLEWRLYVAQQALAALASFKSAKDPAPWVAEAQKAADQLMKESNDEYWQQRIQWEVGVAYLYATEIEHLRMKTSTALRYGQLSIENLAEGAKSRQAVPECERLVGRLYFYIGAVHAIHNSDHEKAVLWYDRAAPLLTSPKPVSEFTVPRRDGEQLVSMGVSFWQTGQQDRALELTKAGTAMIERAVEDEVLAKSSLAVPYSNLSSMFKAQGDTDDAAKYAQLAKSAGSTKRASRSTQSGARSQTSQVQPASTSPNRAKTATAPRGKQSADSRAATSKSAGAARPSPHDPRVSNQTESQIR